MAKDAAGSTLYFGPWYRRSPYFEATVRNGCTCYDIYNHMYLPGNFADPVEEYWHLLEHVAVWDVGAERQVEITGPDAFTFTNLLTPRDLSQCAVGQGKYVVITAPDGGIVNDPVLLRLGQNQFWLSAADSDLLLWCKGVAVNSGLDVEVREPDVSPLQVQGPKSREVLKALVGSKVLDLLYYQLMEAQVGDIPVVVSRTGFTGEVGYEIYLRDGSRGDELWERVLEAGRPFNIRPTGPSDIRRIEVGMLNHGSDMTLENNPFEVGLGWLVDEGKEADSIGKAALQRIRKEGVNQKLVGVEVGEEPFPYWPRDGWPVRTDGRPIGRLTALAHSPRLQKNIGYAMVPTAYAALGTKLTVEAPGGELGARVVPKPFVDPKKETPKA